MANEKLLIVDDEFSVRLALKTAFVREGMQVSEAINGTEALQKLAAEHFDLIILDVMMDDVDGYTVLQKLRAAQDVTPVLMLSGRQEEMDQVLGLGLGADDYLTKPFHLSVLVQKVKAMLRRSRVYNQGSQDHLAAGPFLIDLKKMEAYRDGAPIWLTGRELQLFRFFMENPGRVFTKEQLYHQVWNENVVDDNTIMVYISRLREKIGDDKKNPVYIKTIRGIGYIFDGNAKS